MFECITRIDNAQLCNFNVCKVICPTCDACPAVENPRSAGLSTALRHHSQAVLMIVKKTSHILRTTWAFQVGTFSIFRVIYGDHKAIVLTTGFVPGQDNFCSCSIWTFTALVVHWTCICSMKQKIIMKID